jgi:hypothetical protein
VLPCHGYDSEQSHNSPICPATNSRYLWRDLIEVAGQVPEVRERLEQERHAAAVHIATTFQHQFQFAGRQQEMFDQILV